MFTLRLPPVGAPGYRARAPRGGHPAGKRVAPLHSCQQLPFLEPRHDLLDGLVGVLVLDDLPGLLLRRVVEVAAVDLRALAAAPAGLDARVGRGERVERLLLRAHDRLERRVARLVDRIADGDDGRQLDLDGVVAVLRLALTAQLALLHLEVDDLGERGSLEVVGHDGADRVALAVVGLLPEQDEVRRLLLQRLGQGVAGGRDVGTGERLVGEVHGAVGAERHGLVEGAQRTLGAHRDRHDLLDGDVAALLDLHRRLDGVRVERVQVLLPAAVHAPRRGIDALLDGGVRNLFDQDANLQNQPPSGVPSDAAGTGTAGSAGNSGRTEPGIITLLTDQSIAKLVAVVTRRSPRPG